MKLKDIIKNIRNNNTKKGNADVGEYSRYLLEILAEIKENALVQNGGPTDVMDHAVRLINGFEYISKLGFSVKGGIKNRTQAALNWVKYGTRGYNISRDFYNTSSREYDPGSKVEYTNSAMKDRQMKRFGFMVGDKAKMSNVAAATGGSIDMLLVPKGFDIDASGDLSRKRTWAELPDGAVPDGICLDDKGGIWSASPTTNECIRQTEGGDVSHRIETERGAFACMIGNSELYVLTSTSSVPADCRRNKDARVEVYKAPYDRAGLP